jgi:hypothetical protein
MCKGLEYSCVPQAYPSGEDLITNLHELKRRTNKEFIPIELGRSL